MKASSNTSISHAQALEKLSQNDLKRAIFECEKIKIASFIRTRADEIRSNFKNHSSKVPERQRFRSEPNIKASFEPSDTKNTITHPISQTPAKDLGMISNILKDRELNSPQRDKRSVKHQKTFSLTLRRSNDNKIYNNDNQIYTNDSSTKAKKDVRYTKRDSQEQSVFLIAKIIKNRLSEALDCIRNNRIQKNDIVTEFHLQHVSQDLADLNKNSTKPGSLDNSFSETSWSHLKSGSALYGAREHEKSANPKNNAMLSAQGRPTDFHTRSKSIDVSQPIGSFLEGSQLMKKPLLQTETSEIKSDAQSSSLKTPVIVGSELKSKSFWSSLYPSRNFNLATQGSRNLEKNSLSDSKKLPVKGIYVSDFQEGLETVTSSVLSNDSRRNDQSEASSKKQKVRDSYSEPRKPDQNRTDLSIKVPEDRGEGKLINKIVELKNLFNSNVNNNESFAQSSNQKLNQTNGSMIHQKHSSSSNRDIMTKIQAIRSQITTDKVQSDGERPTMGLTPNVSSDKGISPSTGTQPTQSLNSPRLPEDEQNPISSEKGQPAHTRSAASLFSSPRINTTHKASDIQQLLARSPRPTCGMNDDIVTLNPPITSEESQIEEILSTATLMNLSPTHQFNSDLNCFKTPSERSENLSSHRNQGDNVKIISTLIPDRNLVSVDVSKYLNLRTQPNSNLGAETNKGRESEQMRTEKDPIICNVENGNVNPKLEVSSKVNNGETQGKSSEGTQHSENLNTKHSSNKLQTKNSALANSSLQRSRPKQEEAPHDLRPISMLAQEKRDECSDRLVEEESQKNPLESRTENQVGNDIAANSKELYNQRLAIKLSNHNMALLGSQDSNSNPKRQEYLSDNEDAIYRAFDPTTPVKANVENSPCEANKLELVRDNGWIEQDGNYEKANHSKGERRKEQIKSSIQQKPQTKPNENSFEKQSNNSNEEEQKSQVHNQSDDQETEIETNINSQLSKHETLGKGETLGLASAKLSRPIKLQLKIGGSEYHLQDKNDYTQASDQIDHRLILTSKGESDRQYILEGDFNIPSKDIHKPQKPQIPMINIIEEPKEHNKKSKRHQLSETLRNINSTQSIKTPERSSVDIVASNHLLNLKDADKNQEYLKNSHDFNLSISRVHENNFDIDESDPEEDVIKFKIEAEPTTQSFEMNDDFDLQGKNNSLGSRKEKPLGAHKRSPARNQGAIYLKDPSNSPNLNKSKLTFDPSQDADSGQSLDTLPLGGIGGSSRRGGSLNAIPKLQLEGITGEKSRRARDKSLPERGTLQCNSSSGGLNSRTEEDLLKSSTKPPIHRRKKTPQTQSAEQLKSYTIQKNETSPVATDQSHYIQGENGPSQMFYFNEKNNQDVERDQIYKTEYSSNNGSLHQDGINQSSPGKLGLRTQKSQNYIGIPTKPSVFANGMKRLDIQGSCSAAVSERTTPTSTRRAGTPNHLASTPRLRDSNGFMLIDKIFQKMNRQFKSSIDFYWKFDKIVGKKIRSVKKTAFESLKLGVYPQTLDSYESGTYKVASLIDMRKVVKIQKLQKLYHLLRKKLLATYYQAFLTMKYGPNPNQPVDADGNSLDLPEGIVNQNYSSFFPEDILANFSDYERKMRISPIPHLLALSVTPNGGSPNLHDNQRNSNPTSLSLGLILIQDVISKRQRVGFQAILMKQLQTYKTSPESPQLQTTRIAALSEIFNLLRTKSKDLLSYSLCKLLLHSKSFLKAKHLATLINKAVVRTKFSAFAELQKYSLIKTHDSLGSLRIEKFAWILQRAINRKQREGLHRIKNNTNQRQCVDLRVYGLFNAVQKLVLKQQELGLKALQMWSIDSENKHLAAANLLFKLLIIAEDRETKDLEEAFDMLRDYTDFIKERSYAAHHARIGGLNLLDTFMKRMFFRAFKETINANEEMKVKLTYLEKAIGFALGKSHRVLLNDSFQILKSLSATEQSVNSNMRRKTEENEWSENYIFLREQVAKNIDVFTRLSLFFIEKERDLVSHSFRMIKKYSHPKSKISAHKINYVVRNILTKLIFTRLYYAFTQINLIGKKRYQSISANKRVSKERADRLKKIFKLMAIRQWKLALKEDRRVDQARINRYHLLYMRRIFATWRDSIEEMKNLRLKCENFAEQINAFLAKKELEEKRDTFLVLKHYIPKIRLEYHSVSSKDAIIFEKEVDRTPMRTASPRSTKFRIGNLSNVATPMGGVEKRSTFADFHEKFLHEQHRTNTLHIPLREFTGDETPVSPLKRSMDKTPAGTRKSNNLSVSWVGTSKHKQSKEPSPLLKSKDVSPMSKSKDVTPKSRSKDTSPLLKKK